MARGDVQVLPADLFHLLSEQLMERQDFPTLYNFVVSSRQLANSGGVSSLYRISHDSPVKAGGNEGVSLAEQDLNVQKWSILWRTIILSALGKTLYPYCRYLRALDLRDLNHLLDDDKFRGRIVKHFFSDELARFHFVINTPGKGRLARLDTPKIIRAIGDEITQQAPLLEGLSEPARTDILTSALLTWAPRLTHLRNLDLFDGKALADETLRNLLHTHCPNLEALQIYLSSSSESDHALATFIGGMHGNKLTSFENQSNCGIGPETCLALNRHGRSLKTLKLSLTEQGILALGLLQECTAVQTLSVASDRSTVDLKATQNDVFLEIIEWLKNCSALKVMSLKNIVPAPDLITPVLLNGDVSLVDLDVDATNEDAMYVAKDHRQFHTALAQQRSLRRLNLRAADPDAMTLYDMDAVVDLLCSLSGLRELKLTRISEYFDVKHICHLAQHLTDLEDLYIGGYGISDDIWDDVAKLKRLKAASFSGTTSFTKNGIIAFINMLGPGNAGMSLSVDNADPYSSPLTTQEQDVVREEIGNKVGGRFEYQLLRDPNVPEFDSDDSD